MNYAKLRKAMQPLRSSCRLKKSVFLTMLLLAGVYNTSIAVPIRTEVTQQTRKVTGTVISKEDNMSVVGATILVEGTNIGAITNIDGKFTLNNIPANAKKRSKFPSSDSQRKSSPSNRT
ncbi:MAG: carboxypeptidase-like regulatory domain-containing protein [Bacteroides sp.]|nr:carboxypeptidase-like regulatory domain-containing protein [Bacteroides sp.]